MKRIFIDAERCDGCKNCSLACMQAHRSVPVGTVYDLDLTDPYNESRNTILQNAAKKCKPLFCRHCDKPECVAACMSGAMAKDPVSGHVQYNVNKCAQCFMCVMNCPFGVLKPDRATGTYVIKCDFCTNKGADPSCVKMCAKSAIYVKEV